MGLNREKLIVALDFSDFELAKIIVNELGDHVNFYKIGLEMLSSGDFTKFITWLKVQGKSVFADLKLYDIPETVGRTTKTLSELGIDYLSVHVTTPEIINRAVENKKDMKLVGITLLTSMDVRSLDDMFVDYRLDTLSYVEKQTIKALKAGLDGIVCAGEDVYNSRKKFGDEFIIISPGVRLNDDVKNFFVKNEDQKRKTTVGNVILSGASHIVVGRPITRSENIKNSAIEFLREIEKFSKTV